MKTKQTTTTLLMLPAAFVLTVMTGCGQPAGEQAADPADTGSDVQAKTEEATARLNASEGGQRVLQAIDAHGGLEAWYSAPTSSYSWEYSNLGANMRFKSHLVANNETRQIYHRILTLGTPEEVEEVDARMAWDGQDAWISPADIEQPNPRFWAATGYYFESIPFILADPGVNFALQEPADLDGVPRDRVMAYYNAGVGDTPGDTYTLYINRDTGLVDAVLYTVTFGRPYTPSSGVPELPARGTLFRYGDYTTVDGLTVPTRFRGFGYRDGVVGEFNNEAWASDISFREPFDETQLVMPESGLVHPYPQPRSQ